MPKSCKPRPTIYFAASSCSREGVSTGPQRPTPDPPPRYRPPEGRSCRSSSGHPGTVIGCVRVKRLGWLPIGSAGSEPDRIMGSAARVMSGAASDGAAHGHPSRSLGVELERGPKVIKGIGGQAHERSTAGSHAPRPAFAVVREGRAGSDTAACRGNWLSTHAMSRHSEVIIRRAVACTSPERRRRATIGLSYAGIGGGTLGRRNSSAVASDSARHVVRAAAGDGLDQRSCSGMWSSTWSTAATTSVSLWPAAWVIFWSVKAPSTVVSRCS